ncbi:MAG: hypothetical protein JWN95_3761 [Frankiales bacterium]|nr:hypothetical protein [Frankiales bacterium]
MVGSDTRDWSSATNSAGALPSFDEPPVSQVRLGVYFDRLPKLRSGHLGLFWAKLGGPDVYPDTEDLYRDRAKLETFPASAERPAFDLARFDRPMPTKVAFRSRDVSVEVQDDSLFVTWSRLPESRTYPRYEAVRLPFEATLANWYQYLAQSGLGSPQLRQAEISYENQLPQKVGWNSVADLGEVFRARTLPTAAGDDLEDVHLYQRQTLKSADQEPWGRLYVRIDSARTHESTKTVDFSLTVRGLLRNDTPEAALATLDEGHALIVNTFAAATTDKMHQIWKRRK